MSRLEKIRETGVFAPTDDCSTPDALMELLGQVGGELKRKRELAEVVRAADTSVEAQLAEAARVPELEAAKAAAEAAQETALARAVAAEAAQAKAEAAAEAQAARVSALETELAAGGFPRAGERAPERAPAADRGEGQIEAVERAARR